MASHPPHPLNPLTIEETNLARSIVLTYHPDTLIDFRIISLQEPAKALLVPYLDLEHAGKLTVSSPRPPRLAKAHYDVIDGTKVPKYFEAIVDLRKKERVKVEEVPEGLHASLTVYVLHSIHDCCCRCCRRRRRRHCC